MTPGKLLRPTLKGLHAHRFRLRAAFRQIRQEWVRSRRFKVWPPRPQIRYSFILKRRLANRPFISIAGRSRIVYRWLCFAKWSCVSIARKSRTDCHWLRSVLRCIDRRPSRFSAPTADRDQSNWLRSTRFASPLMSASCSPPTADSQSNDCPGRHRACDDVSPISAGTKT